MKACCLPRPQSVMANVSPVETVIGVLEGAVSSNVTWNTRRSPGDGVVMPFLEDEPTGDPL